MSMRIYPSPVVDAESKPFWDGAAAELLMLRRCKSCGRDHFFPRSHCPLCHAPETEWVIASGDGEIYSYSHVVRADTPYTIAYIQLREGPRILSNIIDADPADLRIGQAVTLRFVTTVDGEAVPVFAPVG